MSIATRRGWALALALASAASLAAQARVELPAGDVVFGAPFEVVVTSATPVDAATLAPLVVEELGREVGDGGAVRVRYRARCYEVGEVRLAVPGAPPLTVRSSLPDPPGELEWPSDGWALDEDRDGGLVYGLLALGAATAFAWWRGLRRRGTAAAGAATSAPAPGWDASAALRALALPADGADPVDLERFYRELKAIVRRHCGRRFDVPADVRTSEELLQVAALDDALRADLRPCLGQCDTVLFGRASAASSEHEGARRRAIAFVERSRGRAEVAS